jgi:MATE family multidrug resistance protein
MLSVAHLPVLRLNAQGKRQMDWSALMGLIIPMFFITSLQMVLNLTDTWFVGRISTLALSAVGASYYLVMMVFLFLGGVGLGIQTLVAQAVGAKQSELALHWVWCGLWTALATTPLFLGIAQAGPAILGVLHLSPEVTRLAVNYWIPRMWGGSLSVLLIVLTSYFNGLGRPKYTFIIMTTVVVSNIVFNAWFVFKLGHGIAGAAEGTSLALGVGVLLAFWFFWKDSLTTKVRQHNYWRPSWAGVRQVLALGIPTGLFPAMDVAGLSLYQIMQVTVSPVDGAATQILVMLTSIAYMPAIGISLAGTTLVGQSVGAGDIAWARYCARIIIVMAMAYMIMVGVGLFFLRGLVVPWFLTTADSNSDVVIALTMHLLVIAAFYQVFDALNLAASFCLRGAGDVRWPTVILLVLSWGVFLPLCHMLTFKPDQGWVHFLPQWGLGAVGGVYALFVYTAGLGILLGLRWFSSAWEKKAKLV